MNLRKGVAWSYLLCSTGLLFFTPLTTYADASADLQSQIDAHAQQIKQLEADIAEYQQQLNKLGSQKNTLQSAITTLTVSQKQLASEIQVTNNKIASANLQLQELGLSIQGKETSITENQIAIAKAIRTVAQSEQKSLISEVFSTDSLVASWRATDQAFEFNRALQGNISNLETARITLTTDRAKIAMVKEDLLVLQNNLTLQKRSVDASKAAQMQLLSQTKNQETNYQKLIVQKQASEKAFEDELISLQNQLNLIVHPGLLPKVGSGILSWPFASGFMNTCSTRRSFFDNVFCVTQYFGNTAFSTANPQIYNGHGHNGIDIAAPIGTPVTAALQGIVLDTGNTDLVRGCYSFGKWVMIAHDNGISTLYAHLSQIDVVKGQRVNTGQVLGLSGMTGYATGPHLHFGVYATEGTKIMTLRNFRGATIGCADATMPVATLTAYLNPLSYL